MSKPTPKSSGNEKYKIEVKTGNVASAGTDAHVYIKLYGKDHSTDELYLNNPDNNFEKNKMDHFQFDNQPSCGSLEKIDIYHDNTGAKPGWFLDYVQVYDDTAAQTYKFTCDKWLATDADDGKTKRTIPVDQ